MLKNIRISKDNASVIILDQSRLPNTEVYLELKTAAEMYSAIKELQVRGAPAIGIFTAYAVYVLARKIPDEITSIDEFYSEVEKLGNYLIESRPTAVNLSCAVNRMLKSARQSDRSEALDAMSRECHLIHEEDKKMCRAISEYGLTLVKDKDGILTHCNAGPLATSEWGTGLGTIFLGKECGFDFRVYCDETRPLLQGARITAYELNKAGIDVTLICDNMASIVMKQGKINACFVGCDRVAANGDVANKVGTSGVAVLAKYYNIPFYVFCPSSSVDFDCETGENIIIEERDPEEIKSMFFKEPVAGNEIKCYNPAFDVTDHNLITAIVTEKGICRGDLGTALKNLLL